MATPSIEPETLHDFLNRQLPTPDDVELSRLQSLLAGKIKRQTALDAKLEKVKHETQTVLDVISSKVGSQRTTLEQLQLSLSQTADALETYSSDIGLLPAGNAATPQNNNKSELFQQLSSMEKQLALIEHAQSYVKTISAAADLTKQAKSLIMTEPEKSIQHYSQLVRLTAHVKYETSDRQDHFLTLTSHLEGQVAHLYHHLLDCLSKKFQESLEEISWPAPINPPYGPQLKDKLAKFEQLFRHLLLLKSPEEMVSSKRNDNSNRERVPVPIKLLVRPLSLRFRFHFESSKPTNRFDKPEWYLTHVKNTIATHIPFLISTIQPILNSTYGSDTLSKDLFIHALLEDVTRKVRNSIPKLLRKTSWLSHTIHELLEFDKSLREDFAYFPGDHNGMANILLDNQECYESWFSAEKRYAQDRYDGIFLDGQAFEFLQYEGGREPVKSTKSAVKVMHLIEGITDTYRLLPKFTQKLGFLLKIQLNLLNQYHGRVSSALDSFEALSLIRSVPVPGAIPEAVSGVMTTPDAGGTLVALRRLNRWRASCRYISKNVHDLAEDDFFLDLQYQISQHRSYVSNELAQQSDSLQNFVFGLKNDIDSEKPIFDSVVSAFERLEERTLKLIVRIITREWATNARLYARRWQMAKDESLPSDEISPELYEPLESFRACCQFLASCMSSSEMARIYQELSQEIEEWHLRNVVAPNRLSKEDMLQLNTDLTMGLWKIGRAWVSKPENYMRRLKAQVASVP